MASIIATLTARQGQESKLEQILRTLVAKTSAEDGAIVYDLQVPEGSTGVFVVTERYRDEAARSSHLGSAHLNAALAEAKDLLGCAPVIQMLRPLTGIRQQGGLFEGKVGEASVLPIGPVRLVYLRSAKGLIACGAIDPVALERFGLAAARMRPVKGTSISTLEELLDAEVREANASAQKLGIHEGMTGRAAWALL